MIKENPVADSGLRCPSEPRCPICSCPLWLVCTSSVHCGGCCVPSQNVLGFPLPPKTPSEAGVQGQGKPSRFVQRFSRSSPKNTILTLRKCKGWCSEPACKNISWWSPVWARPAQGGYFSTYKTIILPLFVFGFCLPYFVNADWKGVFLSYLKKCRLRSKLL